MWFNSLAIVAVAIDESKFFNKIIFKYAQNNVDKNKLGPLGCRIIASSPSLQNIKSLQLNQNKIKDGGLRALGTSLFEELEDLSLNDN